MRINWKVHRAKIVLVADSSKILKARPLYVIHVQLDKVIVMMV